MNKPLPRSLQRQLAEAEALQAQIARKPEMLQVDTEVPLDPIPEPEAPAQTPDPTPKKLATSQDDPAKWEQRYRSLQGEFNKLVPDLQRQVADLNAKLEEHQRQAKAQRQPREKLVTEKDVEEFGSDMLDVIERQARQIAQEREDALIARLEQVEAELSQARRQLGDVATTAAATIEEKFWAKLEKLVPDWSEINQSRAWLNWLDQEDELTGNRRQDVLNDHHKRLDAERVAAVFRAFKGTVTVQAKDTDPDDSLEAQVAPARAVAAPSPSTTKPKGRVFTGAEVARFFDPRTRKLYTPEQYQTLEAEINQAISEGRVTP